MRKLLLLFCLCLLVIGVSVRIPLHKKKISSLLLYNIEALAADENIGVGDCLGVGSVDCPVVHDMVFGG